MSISGQTLAWMPSVCLKVPEQMRPQSACAALLGSGAAMRRLQLQIERIGPHFRSVLVRGEVGTGKELVARALHEKSGRKAAPFIVYHAASLGEDGDTMLPHGDSQDAGTLFVDSAEELSADGQWRLLRVLEQKVRPRVIVATAQDLRSMAAAGRFRLELYHRLAMVEIAVEPLRNRVEDIPVLAMHFVRRFSAQYERSVGAITDEAMESLLRHRWPGNLREFENVLSNGVLQCEGQVLGVEELSSLVPFALPKEENRPAAEEIPLKLQDVVDQHVVRVLRECSGNKVRAAEVLGISRSTLYRMLEASSVQG